VPGLALRIPVMMTPRGPVVLRPARGVGDYYTDNCGGSLSWLNPFCYLYLNRDVSKVASGVIDTGFPTPPAPVPIGRTTLAPTGALDAAGNPVYDVVPETAAQNQAANLAQLTSFFSNVADANAPDCTALYNKLFNVSCGGNSPLLWLGLAAGVGVLWAFGGRRGH
jgi:hypothetical protein